MVAQWVSGEFQGLSKHSTHNFNNPSICMIRSANLVLETCCRGNPPPVVTFEVELKDCSGVEEEMDATVLTLDKP